MTHRRCGEARQDSRLFWGNVTVMAKKKTSRVAWVLSAVLAVVVMGGIGLLGLRLRPYWVAKYRGRGADLRGAVLPFAPLPDAFLESAILERANLDGADLRGAYLGFANLKRANLAGANLSSSNLEDPKLHGAN